jgi:hypothetical protein
LEPQIEMAARKRARKAPSCSDEKEHRPWV